MSNKEKLIALANEMNESELVFIIDMIEAYKAFEKRRIYAEGVAQAAKDKEFIARSEKCMKDFEAVDNEEPADGDEW